MKRVPSSLALLAAFLVLGALVVPGVATAQAITGNTNLEFPLTTQVASPCSGEIIDFTGSIHLGIQSTLTPSGNFKTTVHSNTQDVSGTGEQSGATFRFIAVAPQTIVSAPAEETTFTINFRVIGPGADNNLIVRAVFHLTVSPDGQITATVNDQVILCE